MKTASVLILCIGASEAVRLSGWRAPLHLTAHSTATPAGLAALVRAVEREPELVPGVRRVRVLERYLAPNARRQAREKPPEARRVALAWLPGSGDWRLAPGAWDGWARYEVEGTYGGVPWRVRFCKAWEGDRRFRWYAEGGTGWPEQWGELILEPHTAGTRMELCARTRSALPLLGGVSTLLVNPLFLAPTFSGWLRNLARAAEAPAGGGR